MQTEIDDLAELLPVFVTEAEKHLAELEETLVAIEAEPDGSRDISGALRAMHTLKGSALMLGLEGVADVAHVGEDALTAVQEAGGRMSTATVTLLLETTDVIAGMVSEVASGGRPEPGLHSELISRLEQAAASGGEAAPGSHGRRAGTEAPPTPAVENAPTEPSAAAPAGVDASPEGDSAVPPGSAEATPARLASGRTLRVDIGRLDRLVDLVQEIALERRTLAARADALAGDPRTLKEALEEGHRALADLGEIVAALRLVRLGPVFRRFARPVRDIGAVTGKHARYVTEGDDVEVDTAVAEALVEPLTHLVRNAMDHGIESARARAGAGKASSGTITVRARRESASIAIEVEDDGGGLPRAKLVERARQAGIPDPERLDESELCELIFTPGLSTAEEVSDLSGRGVGMDIVRRTIEGFRGSVAVRTRVGEGTVVTLRVPLTVSTIEGLQVRIGDGDYIVPLDSVVECLGAPREPLADEGVVDLRGAALPYVRLRHVFATQGAAPSSEQMLVVRHGARVAGLLVDRLLGTAETMVRPLDPRLRSRLAGTTVLEDGRVALIVDVPGLLQHLTTPTTSGAALLERSPN